MGEPIDSRMKTAHAIAQALRQHRDHAIREINAVSAVPRFSIQRAAGLYVSGNIGNVHAKMPAAVGDLLDMNSVVEITRIIGIDGDDKFIAQILASIELACVDFFGNPIRLLQNISRKFRRQMVFPDDRQHVDARR